MNADDERRSELYEVEICKRIELKMATYRAEIIGGRNDKFVDTCEEFADYLLDNPNWPRLIMAIYGCNHAVVGMKFQELFNSYLSSKAEVEAIRELDAPEVPRNATAAEAIKAAQKALNFVKR